MREPNFAADIALLTSVASLSLLISPTAALAQDLKAGAEVQASGEAAPTTQTTVGQGQPPQNLPPPRSDNDPKPLAPAPTVAATGVTGQAGIGGTQAYARAGVLELGGFANLTSAKDYLSVGFNPTIGYFFMDNVEISAIIGVSYSKQTVEGESARQTLVMALAEPSVHIPFTQSLYGLLGVGFGLASRTSSPGPDAGAGFALAPRLGLNIMIGSRASSRLHCRASTRLPKPYPLLKVPSLQSNRALACRLATPSCGEPLKRHQHQAESNGGLLGPPFWHARLIRSSTSQSSVREQEWRRI